MVQHDMVNDVEYKSCMTYDIWNAMTCSEMTWYMMYDIWYMIYDIRYDMV